MPAGANTNVASKADPSTLTATLAAANSDELDVARWGLRFVRSTTEARYQEWHVLTAVPFVRVGTAASGAAWLLLGRSAAIGPP